MLGVYFSGTGNTRHCVELFIKEIGSSYKALSIEDENTVYEITKNETIVFGYPVYFSNMPKIVCDFINSNSNCFIGKKIFIIATMGLFSGDGCGCAARIFRKHQATVIGGLHLKMPDCIGDEKVLKKPLAENIKTISKADIKIAFAVSQLKVGKPTQDGLNFFNRFVGLLSQRLWFYNKTLTYKHKPNIDLEKCIGCGLCAKLCPMKNIEIRKNKAVSNKRCTLCYRCFSHCPTQALTILGKQVYEQYLFEKCE